MNNDFQKNVTFGLEDFTFAAHFKIKNNMKKHALKTALALSLLVYLAACSRTQPVATKPASTAAADPVEVPDEYAKTAKPIWANAKDSARIAFYNVENLFDTIDEPMTIDSEYMPNSSLRWTEQRYQAKLKNIAKVVDSLGFPSIMGMVEVENRRVLDDLTATTALKTKNYGVAHFDSPDERGIDCALIYRKSDFIVKNAKPHRVVFPTDRNDRTRDILEVSGLLRGTPVTVFVNHFPSRRGGAEESDGKRNFVAQILKQAVDSVVKADANARIIIMGDMNDEPSDKSLTQGLGAIFWQRDTTPKPIISKNALYNLAAGVKRSGFGSYFFRGEWEVIDQIIVSGSFLDGRSKLVTTDAESVFNADFLTYKDRSGKKLPNRTYTGPTYRGGFSDHFPVYMTVYFK
jgi:predicted extracellular nuclease